ncbi:MAG: alkaline phosphatase D family protein [Alloalcanivorax venustensis]|uniref:alkaline phosphatase D family protein n=2 Tax=Alloalcanivorax venustensis TaxID=172371 RepID=UPI003C5B0162
MQSRVEPFVVGPIVGTAGQTSIRILGVMPAGTLKAGQKAPHGRIRWRLEGETRWRGPRHFRINGNFDSSGVVVLRDLEPGRRYQFQAGAVASADSEDKALDWGHVNTGHFRTAPASPRAPVSFLFGSCCYRFVGLDHEVEDGRADRIFSRMADNAAASPTDFVLYGGDQVYADSTWKVAAASSQREYFDLYRQSFGQPNIRRLMANYNHHMILDDHEIENNWPARANPDLWTSKYPAAMKAYQIYQASHSPAVPLNAEGTRLERDPDALWYRFRWGCADFFLMDLRTERVLSRWPWQRKIMSRAQEDAVVAWLEDEPDRVKCLVSSVPLFPEQRWPFRGQDSWEGFAAQRQRLVDAIHDSGCRRLLMLSGDVHASLYARLDRRGRNPIHGWICSGLFWPTALMAFRWYRPMIRDHHTLRGLWKPSLGRVTVPGEVYSRDAFSRVSVDENGATLALFDRDGNPVPDIGTEIRW